MKKLFITLFIFVFFISFNIIYATDYNSLDDAYTYVSNNYSNLSPYYPEGSILDFDSIKNNQDLASYFNEYDYYFIYPYLNTSSNPSFYICFSNTIPTISFHSSSSYVYLKFNINFSTYRANISTSRYTNDLNIVSVSTPAQFPYNDSTDTNRAYIKNDYYLNFSKDDFLNNFYSNFDIYYSNNNLFKANSVQTSLEYNCSYNNDYTEATLSVSLINGANDYNIYYSDDLIYNSGLYSSSSDTQHMGGGASFSNNILDLYKPYNGSLIYNKNITLSFIVLDSENNIILYDHFSITDIGFIESVAFTVEFDNSNPGYLIFSPHLKVDNGYFDIYSNCFYSSLFDNNNNFIISRNGSVISDYSENEFSLLSNNEVINIKYTGVGFIDLELNFEVRNKSTGVVVISRTYSYKLKGDTNATLNNSSLNGVSSDGNAFSTLNENSSLNDIINASSSTFETFGTMFSLLPGFVWSFIGIALIVLIVLRILGR